jgi:hypothetical protein
MATALDGLKATRAVLVSIRDQADRAIADIDTKTAAVPTAAEMQDLLAQMMDAAPAVIAAVTPAVVADPAPTA